jgi:subtilisin family serine protease
MKTGMRTAVGRGAHRVVVAAMVGLVMVGCAALWSPLAVAQQASPGTAVRELLHVPEPWTGAGQRVAVIDSGIAVDGTSAGTSDCFIDTADDPVDRAGEIEYTNSKVIVARAYAATVPERLYPGGTPVGEPLDARALSTHGSHVAGIVGCRSGTEAIVDGQPYPLAGVAPDVRLASYNVFPGLTVTGVGPSDAVVARAVREAVADGMDIINLSLSLEKGGAPATSAAIDEAWRHGVIVVVAAGNDGPDPGTVASPADSVTAVTVGSLETGWDRSAALMVGGRRFDGHVGEGLDVTTTVTLPATVLRTDAEQPNDDVAAAVPNPLELSLGCSPRDYGPAVGGIAVVARGGCTFAQKLASAQRSGAHALLIVSPDGRDVEPVAEGRATLPAMVVHLVAGRALVSAHGSPVTLARATVSHDGSAGRLSEFSARGPAASGLSKPDVLAPGGGVLSVAIGDDCDGSATCFAFESGTSMAAPSVAGVLALVAQAHPEWSSTMVRSAVIHTARLDPQWPAAAQGSGVVDAERAIAATIGIDVTGLVVGPGGLARARILNPTDSPQVVSVAIGSTPGAMLLGEYEVPGSVVVPAGGAAPLTIHVQGSPAAATALLTLTGADGQSIHAIVSTLR